MKKNDKEWVCHGEDHPDINHLDVSSVWQTVGNSHETETIKIYIIFFQIRFFLLCCQNQEDSGVDLQDYVMISE